jgi:hypothetical protein
VVGVGAVATESVCFRVAALVSGLFVRDESVRKERQAVVRKAQTGLVRKAHLEPGEARIGRTCDRQGGLNPRTGRTLPARCERCRRQTLVVGE